MESKNLITVNGRAGLRVLPDTTFIDLSIRECYQTNEEASQTAAANHEKLGKVLEDCGLDKSLLKTTQFSISKSTQPVYKDDNFTGLYEWDGRYELSQYFQIEIGVDAELLTRVIHGMGQQLRGTEVNISFAVMDTRSYQSRLLENAVKDATEKAQIIAGAANCTLGQVASIEYQSAKVNLLSECRNLLPHGQLDESVVCCEFESDLLDFSPKYFEVHEDVTVQWYLMENN